MPALPQLLARLQHELVAQPLGFGERLGLRGFDPPGAVLRALELAERGL